MCLSATLRVDEYLHYSGIINKTVTKIFQIDQGLARLPWGLHTSYYRYDNRFFVSLPQHVKDFNPKPENSYENNFEGFKKDFLQAFESYMAEQRTSNRGRRSEKEAFLTQMT